MNLVGKFKLNGILYGIGIKEDKYYVGRVKDKKIYTYLSDNEKIVISSILDQLTPGRDLVEVTSVTIEDRIYKTYYNPSKSMFLFNPKPNESDLKFLNSTYNNQSEYLFNNNVNQTNNYFKRLVKLGKKTVVVILSSAFLLGNAQVVKADTNANLIDDNKFINIVDDTINYDISSDELDDGLVVEYPSEKDLSNLDVNTLSIEDVRKLVNSAITGNINLSEQEKSLMLSNSTIILDNYKYMDLALILDNLNTLKIVYNQEEKQHETWNTGISGTYNWYLNEIDFYNVTNLEEVDITVFVHEMYHMLQTYDGSYSSFFVEGTNALAVDEYLGTEYSYAENRNVIKLLGEIIDKEVIKQYYFTGDFTGIRKALLDIIPDYELVWKFVGLCYQFDCTSYQDVNKNKIVEQLNNVLATYYEAKYGKSIDDDLVALLYYNSNSFLQKVGELNDIQPDLRGNIMEIKDPSIINPSKVNDNYKIVIDYENIDVSKNIDHYEGWSRDEALKNGAINSVDGEDVVIYNDAYIDKLTNKVMIPVYRPTFNFKTIELDSSNRYLDTQLKK